jgi:hypothetical protein
MTTPPQTHVPAKRPTNNSSKVTSGRRTFAEGGDGRGAWTRRWKDLVASHASDLGGEGLSEAQISICRRASAMEIELEAMEARMSEGQPIDIDVYGRLAGRLCRLFDIIGVKRLARPIDPCQDLAKALEAYPAKAIDDDEPNDDEPLPIEEGLDHEPGEA